MFSLRMVLFFFLRFHIVCLNSTTTTKKAHPNLKLLKWDNLQIEFRSVDLDHLKPCLFLYQFTFPKLTRPYLSTTQLCSDSSKSWCTQNDVAKVLLWGMLTYLFSRAQSSMHLPLSMLGIISVNFSEDYGTRYCLDITKSMSWICKSFYILELNTLKN